MANPEIPDQDLNTIKSEVILKDLSQGLEVTIYQLNGELSLGIKPKQGDGERIYSLTDLRILRIETSKNIFTSRS